MKQKWCKKNVHVTMRTELKLRYSLQILEAKI